MKTVGIIAEYNPFHNGHKYHIEQAKQITNADRVIVVMSGDFTQRGTPALIDKYARAKMALLNGADLVLELPVIYACGSAEYFAKGAISILDSLHVVDSICFGSECGDIQLLSTIASVLSSETKEFSDTLTSYLKMGHSYPKARELSLEQTFDGLSLPKSPFSDPNNILGIEYIKALSYFKSNITPHTITRNGAGYHDNRLASFDNSIDDSLPCSALAIRHALSLNGSLSPIETQVPQNVYSLLSACYQKTYPIFGDDISSQLHYKLLLDLPIGYTSYVDVSSDLSDRIQNNITKFTTFTAFCDLLKTKELTYSRISRCLLHILLNIKKEDINTFMSSGFTFYARMLGFRQESSDLLREVKAQSHIPLLSKLANASDLLCDIGFSMLEKDIFASHVYQLLAQSKYSIPFTSEYSQTIMKL